MSQELRYWIFSFDSEYPVGGMGDFQGSSNSLKSAKSVYDRLHPKFDCTYIYDIKEMKEVEL